MPKRKQDRNYAATPMGEVFREGIEPVRTFFNDFAGRAESAFWNFNDKLNGGNDKDRKTGAKGKKSRRK